METFKLIGAWVLLAALAVAGWNGALANDPEDDLLEDAPAWCRYALDVQAFNDEVMIQCFGGQRSE